LTDTDIHIPMANIEVVDLPSELQAGFGAYFTKYVNVYGVNICAREGVENSKIIHAASILAQYLDNDEDGIPDDIDLTDHLYEARASTIYIYK